MTFPRRLINRKSLTHVLQLDERKFGAEFGMKTTRIKGAPKEANFYHFKDNEAPVLFVAHLDTVSRDRRVSFTDTAAGPVVYSRALDDRLGAWIGLRALPSLGIEVDVLLTVGEEIGQSTARYFRTAKQYQHIIEFDRGVQDSGKLDAVTYQFASADLHDRIRAAGMNVGIGSFSDICDLDELGCAAINWSAGYAPGYHGPRAHAYFDDVLEAIETYADFHAMNEDEHLAHAPAAPVDLWPTVTRSPDTGEGCDGTRYCVCNGCFEIWTRLNERELLASIDMWEQR